MTANQTRRTCKSEAWYGISRMTTRYGQQALYVTVMRQGLRVNKAFTVSHYGTEENALVAAQTWRDAVLALLPPITLNQLRNLPRKNSTSGMTGVYREDRKNRGPEWIARIQSRGKAKTATFAVKLYGEEKAKELAIAARQQFLEEAEDGFFIVSSAAEVLASRHFDARQALDDQPLADGDDASMKEQLMQRLRDAGLIGKPQTLPVQRRTFKSGNSPVWEARVSFPNGTRKTRRFSISVYGEEEAEQLAEQAGKQFMAERDALLHPAKPPVTQAGFADKLADYPNQVLDVALELFKLEYDVRLARLLGLAPPILSKIRHHKLPLGPTVIVRILDMADLHIKDLYAMTINRCGSGINTGLVQRNYNVNPSAIV